MQVLHLTHSWGWYTSLPTYAAMSHLEKNVQGVLHIDCSPVIVITSEILCAMEGWCYGTLFCPMDVFFLQPQKMGTVWKDNIQSQINSCLVQWLPLDFCLLTSLQLVHGSETAINVHKPSNTKTTPPKTEVAFEQYWISLAIADSWVVWSVIKLASFCSHVVCLFWPNPPKPRKPKIQLVY